MSGIPRQIVLTVLVALGMCVGALLDAGNYTGAALVTTVALGVAYAVRCHVDANVARAEQQERLAAFHR